VCVHVRVCVCVCVCACECMCVCVRVVGLFLYTPICGIPKFLELNNVIWCIKRVGTSLLQVSYGRSLFIYTYVAYLSSLSSAACGSICASPGTCVAKKFLAAVEMGSTLSSSSTTSAEEQLASESKKRSLNRATVAIRFD